MSQTWVETAVPIERAPLGACVPSDEESSSAPERSSVRFMPSDERFGLRAGGADAMVVRIETIAKSARGRVGELIDEAIERELSARGAASPGIGSERDADAALSDRLYRARQVGVRRVCLALGSLRAIVAPGGALGPEDSATLLFWAEATRQRPVDVVLDADDAALGAHVEAVSLETALGAGASSVDAPTATMATVPAMIDARSTPTSTATSTPTPTPTPTSNGTVHEHGQSPRAVTSTAAPRSTAILTIERVTEDDAWRGWMLALTAARGPQPLAAFERLFAQSYLPLGNAIAAGLEDPRAIEAHDEFRRTFERAYTEACPTFALTGKRPRMVLDAPDVAARIGRLHGARTTQLLLVDGMRFDLGGMVRAGLVAALGSRASLTEETLLWSALPSTTTRQLETLARGTEALRGVPPSEREAEPMRGRTAETIRRVKIGSRDVYKLDIGEAKLREAANHTLTALPSIAESIADVIARHAVTLPARTLLFVFGDHGFTIDARGVARQGGAAPEQVLVPGYAFLMGEAH